MSSSKGDVTKRLSFSSKSEVLPSVKRSCSTAKFLHAAKVNSYYKVKFFAVKLNLHLPSLVREGGPKSRRLFGG